MAVKPTVDREVLVLADACNATVVQLPNRHLPGVVVQGDSLQNLRDLVQNASEQISHGDTAECQAIHNELLEILDGYLASYNGVVSSNVK